MLRESALATKRDDDVGGPDLAAAEETIAQIQNSLGVIRSMKLNCTEAKNNIESVREAVEGMESQIRDKIKTLHIQLQISK